MSREPDRQDLLDIAARSLADGVLPALKGTARYQALMIARVLAIAAREAESGADAERQELQGIESLIPESDRTVIGDFTPASRLLGPYRRALCSEIRSGRFDAPGAGREALLAHLAATTENRLKINNPKALAR